MSICLHCPRVLLWTRAAVNVCCCTVAWQIPEPMAPKAAAATKAKKAARKSTRKVAKPVKRTSDKYTTLRKSVTPGTIAIMLAGRFRGKRVVVLKQLPKNGPLVVTGPFKFNGVPLRRVNSRYIIATSTKIDVTGVDTSKVTDATFKRPKAEKAAKSEGAFMGDKAKKSAQAKAKGAKKGGRKVSDERHQLQKAVDASLIAALKKDAAGKQKAGYLRSVFTLMPGDMPHRMTF